MEYDKHTWHGEGLYRVDVLTPKGFGIETKSIIDSLKAALELAIRRDEHWIAVQPPITVD